MDWLTSDIAVTVTLSQMDTWLMTPTAPAMIQFFPITERAQKDAAVMSDEEKRKAQTELQDLSVQYQAVGERVNTLLEQRRQAFQQNQSGALPGESREEKRNRLLKNYEAVITDLTVDQKTKILVIMEAGLMRLKTSA